MFFFPKNQLLILVLHLWGISLGSAKEENGNRIPEVPKTGISHSGKLWDAFLKNLWIFHHFSMLGGEGFLIPKCKFPTGQGHAKCRRGRNSKEFSKKQRGDFFSVWFPKTSRNSKFFLLVLIPGRIQVRLKSNSVQPFVLPGFLFPRKSRRGMFQWEYWGHSRWELCCGTMQEVLDPLIPGGNAGLWNFGSKFPFLLFYQDQPRQGLLRIP